MPRRLLPVVVPPLRLAGCHRPPALPGQPDRALLIEQRKDFRVCHFLLAAVLLATGMAPAPAAAEEIDTWTAVVEHRKDVVVARLGVCESGTSAHPDRSGYIGPYQFSARTVIAYVRERDGRTIDVAEAQALARDHAQAAELAKYVIFERNGASHWPACSRKLGLARQVGAIRVP